MGNNWFGHGTSSPIFGLTIVGLEFVSNIFALGLDMIGLAFVRIVVCKCNEHNSIHENIGFKR